MPRIAAILLLAATLARAQSGDWSATLDFGSIRLRLILHLDGAPSLDLLDQDAFGLPLRRVTRDGRSLRFEAPNPGGTFEGELSADGEALEGWWTQRDGELPLRFLRGTIRPQEPRAPFPYDAQDVTIRGRVRMGATLTTPRAGGPHPAVVLVTGSGAQDRNGTVSGHRPNLIWADFLTRRGFAVLRADDRGIGGSGGKLLDSTGDDFAADVLAQIAFLKGRRDIDPRRIGIVGHSEGAAVAALAASRDPSVAFLVMLAGPAVPGERILTAQSERIAVAMGIPEAVAATNREIQRKLFSLVRSGAGKSRLAAALERETASLPPDVAAVVKGQLGGQLDVAASRWFRYVLGYDPAAALALVRCRALALYGSLDMQAPADLNAPAMRTALPAARVEVLPGLNHMFQRAATGSPIEYTQIEETVAPDVLELVGKWLAYTPQQ